MNRKLIGKIEISGELICLTGLHIGASKENMEIGALDSPVVRDPLTLQPYIPGSSLKGKLRALLEKATSNPNLFPNRDGGSGINRHECDDLQEKRKEDGTIVYPGALNCPVCRLFGSTAGKDEDKNKKNKNFPSRLKVRDLSLTKDSEEKLKKIDTGLLYTEWKFENSIDRITSAANPRNLERVPKGAIFDFSIVYDVEDDNKLSEDLTNLKLAIRLLHDDALGGHGSRGYGEVGLNIKAIEAKKIGYYKEDSDTEICKIEAEKPVKEEDKEEAKKTILELLNQEKIKELAEFFQNGKDAK